MKTKRIFLYVIVPVLTIFLCTLSFHFGSEKGGRDMLLTTSRISAITLFSTIEKCRKSVDKEFCIDLLDGQLDSSILELDGLRKHDQKRKSTIALFKKIKEYRKKYPRKRAKEQKMISDKIEEILGMKE